ncbi:OmpA family protein [Ferruginibacter albus]|uniref:OmpA family protein n=1 Tax=Ferruginibacter albus TaxID=2875540 RepID=UPI001CC5A919|nr:OmpA family protein [Ferruginibacter albus]UAY51320.1 OmpA family protein [Ferruginibacter albus]
MHSRLTTTAAKALFIAGMFIVPSITFGQSSPKLMAANKFYKDGDYYSAVMLYEELSDSSKKDKPEVKPYSLSRLPNNYIKSNSEDMQFRMGYSYFQLHNYKKAQPFFENIKDKNSQARYYAGICERANQQYVDASKDFNEVLKSDLDSSFKNKASVELNNLQFVEQELNKSTNGVFSAENISSADVTANYALTSIGNDIIITSSRKDSVLEQQKGNPYMNQLYAVSITNDQLSFNNKLAIPFDKGTHQGIASFTPDGNKLFFTKWTRTATDTVASIYISTKQMSTWQAPVKLSNKINVDGYKSMQPFVTSDGKYLIFASDRPGGNGKLDLWYAPLDSNFEPGDAINLGKNINTNGNDETPFYHNASQTLIFASDGRVGMGALDLYKSTGELTSLSTPENLGYPINSSKDDLYFYSTNKDSIWKDAYISSDRASECCLQLVAIKYTPPPPPDTVKNIVVDSVKQDTTAIVATDKQPVVLYFDFDKSSLTDSAQNLLNLIAEHLRENPSTVLDFTGYTDGFGSSPYNLNLSKQRAEACRKYLLDKGITDNQIKIHYLGKCCPVANEKDASGNDNPEGRQMNRRVELKYISPVTL